MKCLRTATLILEYTGNILNLPQPSRSLSESLAFDKTLESGRAKYNDTNIVWETRQKENGWKPQTLRETPRLKRWRWFVWRVASGVCIDVMCTLALAPGETLTSPSQKEDYLKLLTRRKYLHGPWSQGLKSMTNGNPDQCPDAAVASPAQAAFTESGRCWWSLSSKLHRFTWRWPKMTSICAIITRRHYQQRRSVPLISSESGKLKWFLILLFNFITFYESTKICGDFSHSLSLVISLGFRFSHISLWLRLWQNDGGNLVD